MLWMWKPCPPTANLRSINLRNAKRFKHTMFTAMQLATGKLDIAEMV